MTWALKFTPKEKGIGSLAATWNAGQPDEFTFEASVNLDAANSTDDFVARAQKELIVRQQKLQEQDAYAPAVSALETRLNK